ncbi:MAG: glycosyltransferase family 2 protein [Candidatus Roizmanbacteria bacterium]
MQYPLSAVVLTKNEEKNIRECLKSLSFSKEIIVIDNNSVDNTIQIAKEFTSLIFRIDVNDFSQLRTKGLEESSLDWVLYIDADERVTDDLAREIGAIVEDPFNYNTVFALRRKDIWHNSEVGHGEVSDAYRNGIIRLVHKKSGVWCGKVHEEFKTKERTLITKNIILHYPHPTLSEFIHDVNIYSTIRAQELYNQKAQISMVQLICFPFGKFIYTYFIRAGFKDGYAGFIYSFLMSFHSFLVRAKLYQLTYLQNSSSNSNHI